MTKRTIVDILRDNIWQTVTGVLSVIIALLSLWIAFFPPGVNHPSPQGASPPQVTAVSSPVSSSDATATPTPSPSPAAMPTPSPTAQPTPSPMAALCPTAAASTSNVGAVVTETGCPPQRYPVSWVFGFVGGKGIGMTSSVFMSYGSGQYLGYISELGIAPTAPYSGVPRNTWLYQLGSGYAIVISDTAAQPTAGQLGIAVIYGGGYGMGDGVYLPQNFQLISTTPQPGGAQGYQFNLGVKT